MKLYPNLKWVASSLLHKALIWFIAFNLSGCLSTPWMDAAKKHAEKNKGNKEVFDYELALKWTKLISQIDGLKLSVDEKKIAKITFWKRLAFQDLPEQTSSGLNSVSRISDVSISEENGEFTIKNNWHSSSFSKKNDQFFVSGFISWLSEAWAINLCIFLNYLKSDVFPNLDDSVDNPFDTPDRRESFITWRWLWDNDIEGVSKNYEHSLLRYSIWLWTRADDLPVLYDLKFIDPLLLKSKAEFTQFLANEFSSRKTKSK